VREGVVTEMDILAGFDDGTTITIWQFLFCSSLRKIRCIPTTESCKSSDKTKKDKLLRAVLALIS
jgi:hypothetical protein